MKCPNCGKWNKSSLPRCFHCGYIFPKQPDYLQGQRADWEYELEQSKSSQKTYIYYDEISGEEEPLIDRRDVLAKDIASFKERKDKGEKIQKTFRKQSIKKGIVSTSRTVRRDTDRSNFFEVENSPPRNAIYPNFFSEHDDYDKQAFENFTAEYSSLERENIANLVSAGDDSEQNENLGANLYSNTTYLYNTDQLYDGFDDTHAYEPLWHDAQKKTYHTSSTALKRKKIPVAFVGFRRVLRYLSFAFILALFAFSLHWGVNFFVQYRKELAKANAPIVMASIYDDKGAHTILIPGESGTEIFIRENKTTYPVIEGIATVEIPDYIWYENDPQPLPESKLVSLTPFLKLRNGDLEPLDSIQFEISIPLSPIEILNPDTEFIEISKALYAIKVKVEPGSKLYINDTDLSDLVNRETGEASHNATIQPIGDNVFKIRVLSEFARETISTIVIHRAYQEIPLDLSAVLADRTINEQLKISAETLVGATINVLSPHTDLDITTLDVNGTFSFTALFDHYGSNTITITADYPNKKQSAVNYDIIYVPTPDIYTIKAWPMVSEYTNFLSNTVALVNRSQIYECKGIITDFVSIKPQLAIMNIGTEESPLNIMVENGTRTTWELGNYYRLYADAYGLYGEIPRLTARYTYSD